MALVLGLRHAGVVAPPDPLFLVVLLLAHSTPTAINMQTLATIHQNGEAEMSCMLCAPVAGRPVTRVLTCVIRVA